MKNERHWDGPKHFYVAREYNFDHGSGKRANTDPFAQVVPQSKRAKRSGVIRQPLTRKRHWKAY
jgi:hypothetical protein